MTAETESPGTGDVGGHEVVMKRSWGRTALRVLVFVLAFAALVAFSVLLAELTLTPSPASKDIAGANLRPGHSLRQYADDYTFLGACKQIVGNLLIGAPFGVILPVLVPRRLRMVRVVLLTALVMVLVELAQGALIEGRAFDVDDVILNTSGAIIAYVLVGRIIGHKYHALAEPRPVRVRRGWFGGLGGAGRAGRSARVDALSPTPEKYRELKGAKEPGGTGATKATKGARAGRTLKTLKRDKAPETLERKAPRPAKPKTQPQAKKETQAKTEPKTKTQAKKAVKAKPSAAGGTKAKALSKGGGPAPEAGARRTGGLAGLLRRH
ncbi:VanZ family protein [Streptomyces sp. DW26H14]|uniref:VanZ family protein n=1 Tax=Streptomyces sp. DW26H14 TaxID=3435395 RepID=UPI00403D7AC3